MTVQYKKKGLSFAKKPQEQRIFIKKANKHVE